MKLNSEGGEIVVRDGRRGGRTVGNLLNVSKGGLIGRSIVEVEVLEFKSWGHRPVLEK